MIFRLFVQYCSTWIYALREHTKYIRAGPAKRVESVFNRGCTAQFKIVFHKKMTTCSTDIYDHDSYGSFFFFLAELCLMKDFRDLDYS